ncbi:unnamed protein product [Sympodiomycopsis kandeliae]
MQDLKVATSKSVAPLQSDDRKIVRKIERDAYHRLRSIVEDAEWVTQVSQALTDQDVPVIPNLRCGAWYVPSALSSRQGKTFCYFKSTDGHAGQWSFSLKRPNLDVARLIMERGSVIVTDSTRRGKSMPDALSKTIPIWCAVLTEASRRLYGTPLQKTPVHIEAPFRESTYRGDNLWTPAHQIPLSEHYQMQERIAQWVDCLCDSDLTVPKLDKPLVPHFLTPHRAKEEILSGLKGYILPTQECHPVVLLSASRRVDLPTPSRDSTYYYVQGSGDDEEIWSYGLTPEMFWSSQHHDTLNSASQEDLPSAIQGLVESDKQTGQQGESEDVRVADSIFWIGRRPSDYRFTVSEQTRYDLILHCDGRPQKREEDNEETSSVQCFGIAQGKAGLTSFRSCLPIVIDQVRNLLSQNPTERKILIVDSTGKDLNIGFAVTLLSVFYTSHREFTTNGAITTKEEIRKRLQWIVKDLPDANPSRKHMLRINEVLLSSDRAEKVVGDIDVIYCWISESCSEQHFPTQH